MARSTIILIRNAHRYDFGGGERFPVFVASILKQHELTPLIISRSPKLLAFAHDQNVATIRGWWWSRQTWTGGGLVLFPLYIVWQLLLCGYYITLFIKHHPRAVHVQSKDDFIAATVAARLVGATVIWTDHADLKHVWKNLSIWYKNPVGKLVRCAANLAHTITVVSRSELELVSQNLTPHSPIRRKLQVVYNGVVDTATTFTQQRNTLRPLTFCVASRLVTDKGIREVIEAYQAIKPQFPNSQLLILGDGPEADAFSQLATDTSSIHLLGYQKDPLSVMASADIFVHPTYHEGFSVALVEASMLSLPIIATSVGGNVEIIRDNTTGLLVPPRDSIALATAMTRLAQSDTLRSNLGYAARQQYLERFQFDRIVTEQFLPLYRGEKS